MIKDLMQIKFVSRYLSNFSVGFCHIFPLLPRASMPPTVEVYPALYSLGSSSYSYIIFFTFSSQISSFFNVPMSPAKQTNIDPSSSLAGCCWRKGVIIKSQSFDSCFLLLLLFLLQYTFIYIHFSQGQRSHSIPPPLSATSDKIILEKSYFL